MTFAAPQTFNRLNEIAARFPLISNCCGAKTVTATQH
jgi:hypothetical protein